MSGNYLVSEAWNAEVSISRDLVLAWSQTEHAKCSGKEALLWKANSSVAVSSHLELQQRKNTVKRMRSWREQVPLQHGAFWRARIVVNFCLLHTQTCWSLWDGTASPSILQLFVISHETGNGNTVCLSLPGFLCSHPSSVHLALGKSGVCCRAQMCIRRRRTGSYLPFISADVSLWRWDLCQVPFNCSSLPPDRVVFIMSGLATVEKRECYHLPVYSDTLCMYVVFNQAE